VGAELADAAAEVEFDRLGQVGVRAVGRPVRALIGDRDRQAGHEVGGLPRALDQLPEIQIRIADEDVPVRPEPGPGAGPRLGQPAHLAQS
jgi:hypothetical protein